ncbi:HupE/UreJ family protein [Atopomonas hussainii]|uniref:HupE/UreJ family protein n=1 Tax=Atopomonas hussainii TaxID=1429083 RepID=UPI0009004298|nr:HupE/UreJ family protein [Atopomonas hussainii]
MQRKQFFTLLAALSAPSLAFAHPGHDATWYAGLAHPLLGLDHLLVLLCVGVWAARQNGALRWQAPLGFALAMLTGAVLGAAGLAVSALESAIAFSVLALGLMLALSLRLSAVKALPLLAGFALLHGVAHGQEIPAGLSPALFIGGMLLASALLMASSGALSHLLRRVPLLSQGLGWGVAASGAALLIG